MNDQDPTLPVEVAIGRAIQATLTGYLDDRHAKDEITRIANAVNAAVREHVDRAQAEVANDFVRWSMKNEIAEGPLDWDWFGEIARRYSPLHEEHNHA